MRSRHLLIVPFVVVALTSVAACKNLFRPSGDIEYSVTGSATRVDITYENSTGGTSQISGASLPWSRSWSDAKKGDFLYVSAQIVNTSGGSITVTIKTDGDTFKSGSASGFAAIATASGTY